MAEKPETTAEEKATGTAIAAYTIAQATATKLNPADQKEMADLLRGFSNGLSASALGLSPGAVRAAQYRLNETIEMLERNAAK